MYGQSFDENKITLKEIERFIEAPSNSPKGERRNGNNCLDLKNKITYTHLTNSFPFGEGWEGAFIC